jgi:uncharacterized membrane protein
MIRRARRPSPPPAVLAGALMAMGVLHGVSVFPANVQMARDWRRRPWPDRAGAYARLPLQVPMVAHALRVRREAA